jgi:hypothetical protein
VARLAYGTNRRSVMEDEIPESRRRRSVSRDRDTQRPPGAPLDIQVRRGGIVLEQPAPMRVPPCGCHGSAWRGLGRPSGDEPRCRPERRHVLVVIEDATSATRTKGGSPGPCTKHCRSTRGIRRWARPHPRHQTRPPPEEPGPKNQTSRDVQHARAHDEGLGIDQSGARGVLPRRQGCPDGLILGG